jgi:hypothetical protein
MKVGVNVAILGDGLHFGRASSFPHLRLTFTHKSKEGKKGEKVC